MITQQSKAKQNKILPEYQGLYKSRTRDYMYFEVLINLTNQEVAMLCTGKRPMPKRMSGFKEEEEEKSIERTQCIVVLSRSSVAAQ